MLEMLFVLAFMFAPAVVFPCAGTALTIRLYERLGNTSALFGLALSLFGPIVLAYALGSTSVPCPPADIACGEGNIYSLLLGLAQSIISFILSVPLIYFSLRRLRRSFLDPSNRPTA